MAKRGNGEGSIYFSDKLNRWVAQCYINEKRRSFYGKTRKEANEKMNNAKSQELTGKFVEKSDITVYSLGRQLIDTKFNANLITQATYLRKNEVFKHIINSNFAELPIQKVTSDLLQDFINTKKSYSNSTIDKIYELLGSIFKKAISLDIIYKNPLNNVVKPKSDKQESSVEALTIEEQKAFINALENEKYKNIFLIALHTGMRIGEILALTPEDINFKDKTININKTITKDTKGNAILGGTTKTYNSIRLIPIISLLEPILQESMTNYTPNKNNLLFCLPNGKVMAPSIINSQFKKICKNANIMVKTMPKYKGIDFEGNKKFVNLKTSDAHTHILRHTYATRCIEAGVPAEVLQKLLGHKSITITINTYTTIFDKFKKDSLCNYINYITLTGLH